MYVWVLSLAPHAASPLSSLAQVVRSIQRRVVAASALAAGQPGQRLHVDGWMNEQLTPYLATSLWYGALFAGLGILTNYWRCLSQLSLCVCVSSSEAAPRRSKLLAGWLAGCKESEIVWPYVWQLLYSASFKEDAYTRLHAFGSLVDDDKVAGGEYESVDVRAIVANPLPAATVHQIDDVTLMGILV